MQGIGKPHIRRREKNESRILEAIRRSSKPYTGLTARELEKQTKMSTRTIYKRLKVLAAKKLIQKMEGEWTKQPKGITIKYRDLIDRFPKTRQDQHRLSESIGKWNSKTVRYAFPVMSGEPSIRRRRRFP